MADNVLSEAYSAGNGIDSFSAFGLLDIPDIKPSANIAQLMTDAANKCGGFKEKDILVVASKVVSKAEGMYVSTQDVQPSDEALELSIKTGKPEKICQIVIGESQKYWVNGKALLAIHKQGFELSSAGVDRITDDLVILLPRNPDASAKRISLGILERTGVNVAVIISDSHGRADRRGAGAVALGVYGIKPLRITSVSVGNGKTKIAEETLCDMFAAAAAIIMGQRGRGVPGVCVRGIQYAFETSSSVKQILLTS